jgi:hypothetical protein
VPMAGKEPRGPRSGGAVPERKIDRRISGR